MCFTNGTLIDEDFCHEMLRVQNFVPAISLEGFEEATDCRRGDGTYQKVVKSMNLLKSHKLPFGISSCYTSANIKDVSTEAYVTSWWNGAPFSCGTSTTCPWATTPCPS